LHDDSSLPSIPEQLQRFANASIIIGPHGAGMVNIIASKRRTCLGCTGIVEGIIVRNQLICVSDGAPQRPISGTINVLAAIVPSIILFEGIPIIPNQFVAHLNNLKLRKALEGHSKWEGRIATFTNVVVSSDGWIVHNKHCHAVINGGCKTPPNLLPICS
jgi:hypothetical protein